MGTYAVGLQPYDLALDSANNAIWVCNYGGNTVSKLNAITGAVIGTYAVPGAMRVIVNIISRTVWVTRWSSLDITKLNSDTGAVIGVYTALNNVSDLVLDTVNGALWVCSSTNGGIAKINIATGSILNNFSYSNGIKRLALDIPNNVIWGVNSSINKLSSYNATTGVLINTYTVGTQPEHIKLNYVTKELWVSGIGGAIAKVSVNLNDITTINHNYDDVWSDITNSSLYTVVNNVLTWIGPNDNHVLMVRTDAKFLAYTLAASESLGNFKIVITEIQDRGQGVGNRIMTVPMGELDVYLNGKSLIVGLDYIYSFPNIVITNKRYLVNPDATPQNIHIRFCGFCDSSLNIEPPMETGFIVNGYLSENTKFDLRDDKVLHAVIGGGVFNKKDIPFTESLGVPQTGLNGLPYLIRDIVVPLKNNTLGNTYALRSVSQAIDKTIADYMTLKWPNPVRGLSVIPQRYEVFSPFITSVLYALKDGSIGNSTIMSTLTDADIITICKPYETWLAFDHINPDHKVNSGFVVIHPHDLYTPVTLNVLQNRFLSKVVNIYAKGLVDLTSFITVTPI